MGELRRSGPGKIRARPLLFLTRHSGFCRNELLNLMKDCVRLHSDERPDGKICGDLVIEHVLKRRTGDSSRNEGSPRTASETLPVRQCFNEPQDPTKPLGPWVFEEQIFRIRKKIKIIPTPACMPCVNTFLTEAGEYTDPFTLQYVAGHDNIKTTMRYVHPREAAVHKLFERLADLPRAEASVACSGSVQKSGAVENTLPGRTC